MVRLFALAFPAVSWYIARRLKVKHAYRLALAGLILIAHTLSSRAASAVFGGGPFYSGGTAVMNTLRSSGFTTVILWSIHVDSSTGNLILNDQLVVANGAYVGNSAWPSQLASLKTAPTFVNRIEVSVGSWGVNDFQSVQSLMNSGGTNSTSILYRNFLALKNATGATAVDFDDETLYDTGTTVKFGRMLASIGYKVSLCPYNNASFWQSVYGQLGSIVDAIYLQCYSGGAGNDPVTWNGYFSGIKVSPGLWCSNGSGCTSGDTPAAVASQMSGWRASAGIPGGFMWLYDDMQACASQGVPAAYAAAINSAVDALTISPSSALSAAAAYHSKYLPASITYTLTNSGATSLSWNLYNPASWLSTSATGGAIGANQATVVTVSLNPATATNLTTGQYSATVWFTNRTSGVTWSRLFTLDTAVKSWPLTLSGFNAALLARNTATPSAPGATAFDVPNNYCLYQAGLRGSGRGLPANGSFASLCDATTAFQLGAYGATDALLLGYNSPKSATLVLTSPQGFRSLSFLASSANGGGSGTVVLNFADGTKSQAFSFNAQDWFNTITNVALQGFGRLKLGTTFSIEDNGAANPNLYQTTLNLSALGFTRPISSLTFSNPANAGAQQNTAVFAVSGWPVPTPGWLAAARNGSQFSLTWAGAATLLESTNVAGPWTTNAAVSPVFINPTLPRKFYRLIEP